MWPFTRIVPAREHESCARRLAEAEERIEKLELASMERNLQVLEVAERVSFRLAERKRKRDGKEEPEPTSPYQLILGRKMGS